METGSSAAPQAQVNGFRQIPFPPRQVKMLHCLYPHFLFKYTEANKHTSQPPSTYTSGPGTGAMSTRGTQWDVTASAPLT